MNFPKKRGSTTDSKDEIKKLLKDELQIKPDTVGYRFMWDLLKCRGYHVRRNTVMELMREVDPEGVEFRRKRRIIRKVYRSNGPNHTWHIDGYDKLKPYGFAIHGAIDGYSRKIMWLYVGPSNNDPKIVASYYLQCITESRGCPRILQVDPGTENVLVGALQLMFNDKDGSFRITKSAFNQRIEAWWSILRRRCTEWWIHFFKDLVAFGEVNIGDIHDIFSLRYCFSTLIQKQLDEVVTVWNYHHISRSRQAVVPNGRPSVLYDFPEMTDGINCIVAVNAEDMEWAKSQCSSLTISGSSEFDEKAKHILSMYYPSDPVDWKDSLERYLFLRDYFLDHDVILE